MLMQATEANQPDHIRPVAMTNSALYRGYRNGNGLPGVVEVGNRIVSAKA
jgi:hypothetical protein